ncbi:MAG: hypothetical protein ACOC8A_02150 [bacterium]
MNQADFLRDMVRSFDAAGLRYMVVGSVASSLYGEPRSTYDIDVVAEGEWPVVRRLIEMLDRDKYYVSEEAARTAWRGWRMFNIIHAASGSKCDVIRRRTSDFARAAFQRRRREEVWGHELYVSSPEDIILAKLQWSKWTESERQYRDALGVAKACGSELDVPYLTEWAKQLRVDERLAQLLRDAEIGPG